MPVEAIEVEEETELEANVAGEEEVVSKKVVAKEVGVKKEEEKEAEAREVKEAEAREVKERGAEAKEGGEVEGMGTRGGRGGKEGWPREVEARGWGRRRWRRT